MKVNINFIARIVLNRSVALCLGIVGLVLIAVNPMNALAENRLTPCEFPENKKGLVLSQAKGFSNLMKNISGKDYALKTDLNTLTCLKNSQASSAANDFIYTIELKNQKGGNDYKLYTGNYGILAFQSDKMIEFMEKNRKFARQKGYKSEGCEVPAQFKAELKKRSRQVLNSLADFDLPAVDSRDSFEMYNPISCWRTIFPNSDSFDMFVFTIGDSGYYNLAYDSAGKLASVSYSMP